MKLQLCQYKYRETAQIAQENSVLSTVTLESGINETFNKNYDQQQFVKNQCNKLCYMHSCLPFSWNSAPLL